MSDPSALVAALAAAAPKDQAVAVAVSGGGDSLALLHLAHLAGLRPKAVTVDHGLRAEAAAEAALVAARCADWGLSHRVLRWEHGRPIAGNLMQAARTARYRLMADWARGAGVGTVWLAHTADDQAEGFLMALARGAGLDGLSGMRAEWDDQGVCFARPFLSVSRQRLRDHLTDAGIPWAEDPTNRDDRYTRARIRKALALLEPLGLSGDRIAQTVRHLSAARSALDRALSDWAALHLQTVAGTIRIERGPFGDLPDDHKFRLIRAALRWVNRADHPPRGADQLRFLDAVSQGRGATLQGVRARVTPNAILLFREGRAIATKSAAPGALWDNRWCVTGPFPDGAEIRALGPLGLAERPQWRSTGFHRDALVASPGVWQGEHLIAAPLIETDKGWNAECVGEFRLFFLSH